MLRLRGPDWTTSATRRAMLWAAGMVRLEKGEYPFAELLVVSVP
jgi:hypothetical protein